MLSTILIAVALCIYFPIAWSEGPILQWNLSASTRDKKPLIVLNDIVGEARRGKVHAILGPSGSGKTSLLLAISGTVPSGSLQLFGTLASLGDSDIESIFVAQQDLLFAQLSVAETLDTAVSLKTAADYTAKDRREIVDEMILSLSLKKVRGTKVGDAKTRGLSGGEKKRLAVGNELIASRLNRLNADFSGSDARDVIIFADEVTSGLDSFQAQSVMSLLKDLASNANHTIIVTIHQPRSSVYAMFDDVTLLSEGKIMYTGARDGMVTHFTKLGFPCPPRTNPAEFYLDMVSPDFSSPSAEKASHLRIQTFAEEFRKVYRKTPLSSATVPSDGPDRSVLVPQRRRSILHRIRALACRFSTLFLRSWRQVTRDKALNIARTASSLFSALLFGAIYWKLGKGAGTVPDRLGLLQVAAVNTAMTSLIKATTSFVQEKLIINRERRSGSYSVFPYFVAKLLAEAPLAAVFPCLAGGIIYKLCGLNNEPGRFGRFLTILTVESFASSALGMLVGSFATSVESAVAVAPSVMVIFIVFGGLYVVNAPTWLSWVPKTSLIRWAYEGLAVNELQGLALVPEAKFGPKSVTRGDEVLESMGLRSTVKQALLAQATIILVNYVATYLSLVFQRPKFEKLQPPGKKGKAPDFEVVAKVLEQAVGGEGETEEGGEDRGHASKGPATSTKKSRPEAAAPRLHMMTK